MTKLREFTFEVTVRLTDAHRRAIAKKLGRRGLVTPEEVSDQMLDLFGEWAQEALDEMPRSGRKGTDDAS